MRLTLTAYGLTVLDLRILEPDDDLAEPCPPGCGAIAERYDEAAEVEAFGFGRTDGQANRD